MICDDAEFAIYLNYVRKLGFEETPDYDFLRELFTKVLKNSGETEDGVYDWMMLNGGKGWEAGTVSLLSLSLKLNTQRLLFDSLDRIYRRRRINPDTNPVDIIAHRVNHEIEREKENERNDMPNEPPSPPQLLPTLPADSRLLPPRS